MISIYNNIHLSFYLTGNLSIELKVATIAQWLEQSAGCKSTRRSNPGRSNAGSLVWFSNDHHLHLTLYEGCAAHKNKSWYLTDLLELSVSSAQGLITYYLSLLKMYEFSNSCISDTIKSTEMVLIFNCRKFCLFKKCDINFSLNQSFGVKI